MERPSFSAAPTAAGAGPCRRRKAARALRLAAALLLIPAGCTSIGPGTVPRDRVDYSVAVADSWKQQTLLNIVRLRYADAPTFMDVSSVISAYAFQGQVAAGTGISTDRTTAVPYNLTNVGGNATYLDRPTITYTPLSGDKFTKSLLRPIPPAAIFQLVQAGYPADFVLMLTVRTLNGIANRSVVGMLTRPADPAFYPLLDALRRLQLSGSVSLRLEKRGADEVGHLIIAAERSAAAKRDLMFVERTLNLQPDKENEITIAFGAVPRSTSELAVQSRSMLEILLEVAAGIDVPQDDIARGWTVPPARVASAPNPRDRPFVRVSASPQPPRNAFVAVRYHDSWYRIDEGDFQSKRVFTFLLLFFSLAETGVTPQPPLLTLPVN
ncbi:MAG: hypothetical protein M0Z28_13395 [Rhodospirillales bacterium]|nr:hypothetical protein [Rhodospirillales bacterium]